jgi:hypothetical protein
MEQTIKYTGDNPQYLGTFNNEPFVISKDEERKVCEEIFEAVKKNKWVQRLIKHNLLSLTGIEITGVDTVEKSKKKKKERKVEVNID